jgi:Ser/Thr protein kinase RdoA (MazF antagonist)
MMNVRTMSQVVSFAEVQARPPVAPLAARCWQFDLDTLRYVRSSANHIYAFARGEQELYLRLSPASEREKGQIAAELDFVKHVAERGVAAARPVPSAGGKLVESLAASDGLYHAVVFEGLKGQQWVQSLEMSDAMLRQWGRTVASMHEAAKDFKPAAKRRRKSWKDLFGWARKVLEPEREEAAKAELERAIGWMESLPAEEGNFGLAHGDLELDNLVWDGKRFQVLDFDDCLYHWHAADVAAALEDLWLADGGAKSKKVGQFFKGYREVRADEGIERGDIPKFIRSFQLIDLARLIAAYRDTDARDYAPWLVAMRRRHDGKMQSLRGEFQKPLTW